MSKYIVKNTFYHRGTLVYPGVEIDVDPGKVDELKHKDVLGDEIAEPTPKPGRGKKAGERNVETETSSEAGD